MRKITFQHAFNRISKPWSSSESVFWFSLFFLVSSSYPMWLMLLCFTLILFNNQHIRPCFPNQNHPFHIGFCQGEPGLPLRDQVHPGLHLRGLIHPSLHLRGVRDTAVRLSITSSLVSHYHLFITFEMMTILHWHCRTSSVSGWLVESKEDCCSSLVGGGDAPAGGWASIWSCRWPLRWR